MENKRKSSNVSINGRISLNSQRNTSKKLSLSTNKRASALNQINQIVRDPAHNYYFKKCEQQYKRIAQIMKIEHDYNKYEVEKTLADLFYKSMLSFQTDQQNFSLKQSITLSYWKVLDKINAPHKKKLNVLRVGYIYLLQCLSHLNYPNHNLAVMATVLSKEEYIEKNYKQALKISNEALQFTKKNQSNYSKLLKIHYLKSKIYQQLERIDQQADQIKLCLYFVQKQNMKQNTQITKNFLTKLIERKRQIQKIKQNEIFTKNQKTKFIFEIEIKNRSLSFKNRINGNELKNPQRKKSLQNLKNLKKSKQITKIQSPRPNEKYESFFKQRVIFQRPRKKLELNHRPTRLPEQDKQQQIKKALSDINSQTIKSFSYQNFFIRAKQKKEQKKAPIDVLISQNNTNQNKKKIIQQVHQTSSSESDVQQKMRNQKIKIITECCHNIQKDLINKFFANFNQSFRKINSQNQRKKQNFTQQFLQDDEVQNQPKQDVQGQENLVITNQVNAFQQAFDHFFVNKQVGFLNHAKISIKKISLKIISSENLNKNLIKYIQRLLITIKSQRFGTYQITEDIQSNPNRAFNPQLILMEKFSIDKYDDEEQFCSMFLRILKNNIWLLKRESGISLQLSRNNTQQQHKKVVKIFISQPLIYEEYRQTTTFLQNLFTFPSTIIYNYLYNENWQTNLTKIVKSNKSNQFKYLQYNGQMRSKNVKMLIPNMFNSRLKCLLNKDLIDRKNSLQKTLDQQQKYQQNIIIQQNRQIQLIKTQDGPIGQNIHLFRDVNSGQFIIPRIYKHIKIMLYFISSQHVSVLFSKRQINFWFNHKDEVYFANFIEYKLKPIYVSKEKSQNFYKISIKNMKLKCRQYSLIFNQHDLRTVFQEYPFKQIFQNQTKIFEFLQILSFKITIKKSILYSKIGFNLRNQNYYLKNSFKDIIKYRQTQGSCFLQQKTTRLTILCKKGIKIKTQTKQIYCILVICSILDTEMLHIYLNIPFISRNFSIGIEQNILSYFNIEHLNEVFSPLTIHQNMTIVEYRSFLFKLLLKNQPTSKIYWNKIVKMMSFQICNNNKQNYCVALIARYRGILNDNSVFQYRMVGKKIVHIQFSIKQVFLPNKNLKKENEQYFKSFTYIFQSCLSNYVVYILLTDSQSFSKINYKYSLSDLSPLFFNDNALAKDINKNKSLYFNQYKFSYANIIKSLNILKEKIIYEMKKSNLVHNLFHNLNLRHKFNSDLRKKLNLVMDSKVSLNTSKFCQNNSENCPQMILLHKHPIEFRSKFLAIIFYNKKQQKFSFNLTKSGSHHKQKFELQLKKAPLPYLKQIGTQNFVIIGKRLLNFYKNRISLLQKSL